MNDAMQPGQLVMVLAKSHEGYGQVGQIESECRCANAAMCILLRGERVYSLTILRESCFPESSLRKIGPGAPDNSRFEQLVRETEGVN